MDRSRLKEEDEKLRESRLSGEAVFEGRLLHVYRDRVKLPDGRESTREYLRHPGAAAVVLLKEGKILLERQWRDPLRRGVLGGDAGRVFWEVPAGKLEAGEDPALCAARELEEETGYASDTWTPLGTICPGIGYSNEVISLYLAENPREGSRHLDPGEFLDLAWIPFEEAVRMAETGEIDDAKTIGALFRAEKCLEKRTGIKR